MEKIKIIEYVEKSPEYLTKTEIATEDSEELKSEPDEDLQATEENKFKAEKEMKHVVIDGDELRANRAEIEWDNPLVKHMGIRIAAFLILCVPASCFFRFVLDKKLNIKYGEFENTEAFVSVALVLLEVLKIAISNRVCNISFDSVDQINDENNLCKETAEHIISCILVISYFSRFVFSLCNSTGMQGYAMVGEVHC